MPPGHWHDQLLILALFPEKNAGDYEQGKKTYKSKGQVWVVESNNGKTYSLSELLLRYVLLNTPNVRKTWNTALKTKQ